MADKRIAPGDVVELYRTNVISDLKSTEISGYLERLGAQSQYQNINQTIDIILEALLNDRAEHLCSQLWLQSLEDCCFSLQNVLEDFKIDLLKRQSHETTGEDLIDPGSYKDDLSEGELTDSPNKSLNDFNDCIEKLNEAYKVGMSYRLFEIGETSHGDQNAHMYPHDDNSFQRQPAEECSLTIHDLEVSQTASEDFDPVATPELNSRSHQRYTLMLKFFIRISFTGLNVIFEASQVIISMLNQYRKISDLLSYNLILIASAICLIISLIEYMIEAKRSNVVWQRRSLFGWFYYPGTDGGIFGGYSLNLSVICAVIQFCLNFVIFALKKKFIQADYVLALVLALGHFFRGMINGSEDRED